jgi:cysteinyl-tRNA synthetase
MIRLHDTARGRVEPLVLRDPGSVTMYVCGPTVYGPPHLGHGRFSLVFDVLRRYLEWAGLSVTYVSNITDIDDKIIREAERTGRPWQEVTAEYESVWYSAMEAIGVRPPDHDPHATAYVERMVELIDQLLERGSAYETEDGVYLSVADVEGYGLLAHQSLDDMVAGAGERSIVGEAGKRDPSDFVLWKFAKQAEPAWPSPWGPGRPGWHTECVVMSLDLLGEGFDIHGGGLDLAFPHHENERAQAVALGRDFASHWVHNGFVEVGGQKMAKSVGNFTTLTDLIAAHDPRAYRLLVLQSHYRSPIEVTPTAITQAEAALDRLDALGRRVRGVAEAEPAADRLDMFRAHMDNDLDTASALALVFGLVTDINRLLDDDQDEQAAPLVAAWTEMLAAVGMVVRTEVAAPPEILELARRREEARERRDYGTADVIREELAAAGWLIEDGPGGASVRPV